MEYSESKIDLWLQWLRGWKKGEHRKLRNLKNTSCRRRVRKRAAMCIELMIMQIKDYPQYLGTAGDWLGASRPWKRVSFLALVDYVSLCQS